jgi:hypothetical protein
VLGCDVSEQLELISSAFKVIETQRLKLTCCSCDDIVQAPMPSAQLCGSRLLARIITAKFAEHTPHYRQSEIYSHQGVELSSATLVRSGERTAGATVRATAAVRADARQGAYRRYPSVKAGCPGGGATCVMTATRGHSYHRRCGSHTRRTENVYIHNSTLREQRYPAGGRVRWLQRAVRRRSNHGCLYGPICGEKSTMCMPAHRPTSQPKR